MTDEVLMVVLVLGLEFIINHIGIDDEYTMGSSVRSFDGTTHGKIPVGSLPENILEEKDGFGYGGIMMWSMELKIRRRSSFNLA